MAPREIVRKTIAFDAPERLARSFPDPFGNDFVWMGMSPNPDARPNITAADEWGCEWENIGICQLGEVKKPALLTWDDYDAMNIPDVEEPRRWEAIAGARERAGDKYLLASGISLYERVHFLRGLENAWIDIYEEPEKLRRLIDLLVEMNLKAIRRYRAQQPDGYMFCDDWGLQDRLMIAPEKWREFWKPAYAKVYQAAHAAGMQTFLHSCGDIVDILDDLIEAGLDVIQMDQQENMGLDNLHARFAGRITFWCPVDIQNTMCRGTPQEIRNYCHQLVEKLATPQGGFIAKWYGDPVGAGHTDEAINTMCEEFLRIRWPLSGS